MTFKLIAMALVIAAAVGCAHREKASEAVSSSMPAWIYSPSGEGYTGGVGVCGSHIKGKTGQRELAISRAIDEIARQMGVTVSSVLKVDSEASGVGSDSVVSSYSVQTVSGRTISAFIADSWTDPSTGELYVYMRIR